MIALSEDLILVPAYTTAASGGEPSVASRDTSRSKAGGSPIEPARGGVARTAQLSKAERGTIMDAARPVIIKEILKLLGNDMPDPIAHARYLQRLNFTLLCARRDQLIQEQLPMQLDLHPKYGGADEQ